MRGNHLEGLKKQYFRKVHEGKLNLQRDILLKLGNFWSNKTYDKKTFGYHLGGTSNRGYFILNSLFDLKTCWPLKNCLSNVEIHPKMA